MNNDLKTQNGNIEIVGAIHELPLHKLPLHESAKHEMAKHHRRSIRLQNYDYSQAGAYYVTICTQNRINHFGEIINGIMNLNRCGCIVDEQWRDLLNHFPNLELDEFVIMPNHFHGIIVLSKPLAKFPTSTTQNDFANFNWLIQNVVCQIN